MADGIVSFRQWHGGAEAELANGYRVTLGINGVLIWHPKLEEAIPRHALLSWSEADQLARTITSCRDLFGP